MTVNREPRHRRTQAERSASTRRALLDAARAAFAEVGYSAASREVVVERAGVTRGALHHHFGGKLGLFRAVFEELEVEVMDRVAAAASSGTSALDMLRLGSLAYLDAALDPAVQRICLLDAPAVLATEERQAIVEAHALGLVRHVLTDAVAQGAIEAQPIEPLAHVLVAGLHEAALYVASAADHRAARDEASQTVERIVAGLARRTRPGPR